VNLFSRFVVNLFSRLIVTLFNMCIVKLGTCGIIYGVGNSAAVESFVVSDRYL
jgi:hypothetical protein